MPDSLEQLDLLLLTVAKPRKIHPDGIHFQGLRYLDPVLAAYVGETVIIRYDPRDMAEIRVFHRRPVPVPGHLPRARRAAPSASRRSPPPATPAAADLAGGSASGPASSTGCSPSTSQPPPGLPADAGDRAASPAAPPLKRYREE